MPYKDPEKKKAYQRAWVKEKRKRVDQSLEAREERLREKNIVNKRYAESAKGIQTIAKYEVSSKGSLRNAVYKFKKHYGNQWDLYFINNLIKQETTNEKTNKKDKRARYHSLNQSELERRVMGSVSRCEEQES